MNKRCSAERAAATFVDHNRENFFVPNVKVNDQFANLYFSRLSELLPAVKAAAVARWGASILAREAKTLDADTGAPVLVVGTVLQPGSNL